MNKYDLNITDLEQQIIGTVMLGSEFLERVFEDFDRDIFPSLQAKYLVDAIKKLYSSDSEIDIITVLNQLKELGSPHDKITPIHLSKINREVAGVENIEFWIKILQQNYTRQQYGLLGAKMIAISQSLDSDVVEERENIENMLVELDNKIFNIRSESMNETLEQMKEDNDKLLLSDSEIRGVTTGFKKLNSITSGWKEGQLIIVGAASGGGKSALSTYFAISAAMDKTPVHLISIEMDRKEVLLRAASNMTRIKHEFLDRKGVESNERDLYFDALDRLNAAPLFVDDSIVKSLTDLKFKIKKRVRTHKTRLVIVDYIQIVNNNANKGSREQQVAEISRVLKEIAREYKISVIGLTQMNREHDGKNEPFNDMIRESSGLEHNADVILFIYDPDDEPNNVIKIGKNRGGEKDKYIAVHWEKETFNFIEQ